MFIKLTRLDGSPIWLNSSFIVTVEPRKGGGAIVVPIGDGLDYDVKETPTAVLEMLAGAPAPAVVPVPAPKMLAPKPPDDVSPDAPVHSEPAENAARPASAEVKPADASAKKPAKRTRKTKAKKTDEQPAPAPDAALAPDATAVPPPQTPDAAAPEPQPPEAPAQSAEDAALDVFARPNPSLRKPTIVVSPAPVSLSADQVERLRKLAPGSVRKLSNTLASQFHLSDPEATVRKLASDGVIEISNGRVIWK